jgi:hypothetical protein
MGQAKIRLNLRRPPGGTGPRGIDRGTVLTEPTNAELKAWLIKNGFCRCRRSERSLSAADVNTI